MHDFSGLKQACIRALQLDSLDVKSAQLSSPVIDPQSVLDLITVIERHITDEELQSLHNIITELTNFIRRSSNCGMEVTELLLKSKQVVEVTSIKKDTVRSFYGSIVPDRRKAPRSLMPAQTVVKTSGKEKDDVYKELNVCS
jgi:hypothetical protein